MAAHTAVTLSHDVVADDDAFHGHMFARATRGALMVDAHRAVGQKIRHRICVSGLME